MPKGYYNFNFLLDVRKAIFNYVFLATNMILAKNWLIHILSSILFVYVAKTGNAT